MPGPYFGKHSSLEKHKLVCIITTNGKVCVHIFPSKDYKPTNLANQLKDHKIKLCSIDKLLSQNLISNYTVYVLNQDNIELCISRNVCHDLISLNCIEKSRIFQTLYKKTFGKKLSRHSTWKTIENAATNVEKHLISIFLESPKHYCNCRWLNLQIKYWVLCSVFRFGIGSQDCHYNYKSFKLLCGLLLSLLCADQLWLIAHTLHCFGAIRQSSVPRFIVAYWS